EYTNHAQKICIIDIERNEEFWMLPGNHLNGSNNPSRKKNKKLTQESVLKKFSEVHGDLYDYSKVNYVNSKNKVCIIHPVYGEHWILVGDHFNGVGHPKHGLDK
ncbi:hypothetical protein, partial [Escherichia coli]|uniref:hypothetical protein n=1 Tax=Escherichia coli TaxID=562 RepID=UPI0021D11FAF